MSQWLIERYGSQRGFARTYWHRVRYLLGYYRDYQQVDWKAVDRLVFVCKGNICRSPYAEAVACSVGIPSVSCGIDTRTGVPANTDAIRAAADRGIDLRGHKAMSLKSLDVGTRDLLITMEPWQLEYLRRELGENCRHSLLGLWGYPVSPHIEDPFGTSAAYFDRCFEYIEKSVHAIAKRFSETEGG